MSGTIAEIDTTIKYGKLRIVKRDGRNKQYQPFVLCECDCDEGDIPRKLTRHLLWKVRSNNPRQWAHSCGCRKKQLYLTFMENLASKIPRAVRSAIFMD